MENKMEWNPKIVFHVQGKNLIAEQFDESGEMLIEINNNDPGDPNFVYIDIPQAKALANFLVASIKKFEKNPKG